MSEALELERHTMFQVSTSNALVQGVFSKATTVGDLKDHGDFGLGTFDGLDGELVMLEGSCFRATAAGVISRPSDGLGVPFAVVTRFTGDISAHVARVESLNGLTTVADGLRPSENLFAAIRVDGMFNSVSMRAACPASPGEGLVEATRHQSEFAVADVGGSLVGFWSPVYATSVSVPGYHFHFIADDRSVGGHVLELAGRDLDVVAQIESELHIAIPATKEFLEADLSGDHRDALHRAETASFHGSDDPHPPLEP